MVRRVQEALTKLYGDRLGSIERWSKFRDGQTTQEWLELLGPTAVVLSHQEHFVRVAEAILNNHSGLSEEELAKFYLAVAVHDIGEAAVGDIAAPDKTAKDEKRESRGALKLIAALPESELVAEAYTEVVAGDNAVLHALFRAIERTEYLLTAIHLFEQLQKQPEHPAKLWLMVARVLSFDLPKVIGHAQMFPATIGEYLLARREIISRMLAEASWAVTADFADEFENAKTAFGSWQNVRENNLS